MAKFLTGNELNSELEKILERADEQIVLISPYIKLHERYASTLKTKIDNPNLQITVVFGKNEEDLSKSMKQEDFMFFKQFPNIEIKYEKRLHAKYYANEQAAILTSMNLYSFSQDNNIEAGVMTKATLLGNLAGNFIHNVTGEDNFDRTAYEYFERVIDQSELLFKNTPQFERSMLGLSKKYTSSRIEEDKLSDFFENRSKYDNNKRSTSQVTKKKPIVSKNKVTGYCIRTGSEIPFNIEKPLSYEAFKSWNKYSDTEYEEKYCHFSGESSQGETSVSKPILKKNWRNAKKVFNL